MSDWRVKAWYEPMYDGYAVGIIKGQAVCTGMTFESFADGQKREPTFQNGKDGEAFLRAALNCAWELGLRPDGFHDVREEMKATNAHLQDMRALAFHKIGAPKPAQ